MKKPKLVPKIDVFDLEAEREGSAIGRSNEVRTKKAHKKSKIKTVDSKVLDKEFDDHYGYGGYVARKKEE